MEDATAALSFRGSVFSGSNAHFFAVPAEPSPSGRSRSISSSGGGGAGTEEDLEVGLRADCVDGRFRLMEDVAISSSESSATTKSSISISGLVVCQQNQPAIEYRTIVRVSSISCLVELIFAFRLSSSSLGCTAGDTVLAVRTEDDLVVVFALGVRLLVADLLFFLVKQVSGIDQLSNRVLYVLDAKATW